MNGVIETTTGDLLRAGFCDFSVDGSFDPATETIRTDVPEPPKIKTDYVAEFHRWTGSEWITATQIPPAADPENFSYWMPDPVYTDTLTGKQFVASRMLGLIAERELFNNPDSPIYVSGHTPILGASGWAEDHATRIGNMDTIHGKLGWHQQELIKQGWRRPLDILFYYGYPNSYNSVVNAWNNEKVAQDMARYGIVVLGQGVQDPSHGDYANTQIIIPRVKALNPSCKIFGYVTVNQDLTVFQTKVDQWNTLGVHGIFMDEAGYDYGSVATNGRTAFNTKVDYIHGRSSANLAFANAWNTDHVLGTANDPSYPNTTWNAGEVASNLTANDWILLESLAVNTDSYTGSNGYAPKADWAARVSKMISLRATYGVNFAAVGIINDDNPNGQDLFNFAFVSALMASLDANGTSSSFYGASTAQVAHWTRPDTTKTGSIWTLNASIQVDTGDADVYHRYAEFAKLSLDFSAGAQTSAIALS